MTDNSRDGARRPSNPPAMSDLRVPPHNLDAEASLLGAMLLRQDAVSTASEILGGSGSAAFFKPAHGLIFDAITNLAAHAQAVDAVTVSEELRRAGVLDQIGGLGALVELQNSTPAISNAAQYARIVDETALLRRIISTAGEIAELGYGGQADVAQSVDRAEQLMFGVAQNRVADTTHPLDQLLHSTLDHLETLYQQGEAITGLPTGFHDLDELLSGFQPSTLNVIGARPAMGKCVAWDTPVVDAVTGSLRLAAEVHAFGSNGLDVHVASLGLDNEFVGMKPSNFIDDGIKPVFRVTTSLGRTVRVTEVHPFLTMDGWRPLGELQVGDRVAVPTMLPCFGTDRMEGTEVALLAQRLGTIGLVGPEEKALDDLVGRSRQLGLDVLATLQTHDLWRTDATTVVLPTEIFRLPQDQLDQFCERLLEANRVTLAQDPVLFSTRSSALAMQVMHLMIRFGVVTRLVKGEGSAAGERLDMFELHRVDDLPMIGLPERPTASVFFDEIVDISEPVDEQVFDLTVPELANFVAGDVVVHNTAFAIGIAHYAAVTAKRPVLFFSLEMGARELTQRVLASEARVDLTKFRNGKLTQQDWDAVSKAIGRLEGPLFFDDNPNITVMEIRAKARRMKSRLGGLGLIVIDYLQLMSGRGNAENRQVEVAEMSRGLKILARELETPIIALSQLSRTLESRTDKRPMLADLRESGSIEQDADVVMFLYRDDVYNQDSPDKGIAEVIIAKHRNGPIDTIKLAYIGRYTKFANMAKGVGP
jgi:replicative DNA helicase